MYETVVSGILLGGMMDAFYEDKTLMPPPPRRGKSDRIMHGSLKAVLKPPES